ncbi:hypothetical protein AB0F77_10925 [Streptomyces sp. NPDC026672]|uniref:hypothetical protein n=1 Tax=unclassified Streptomyces TaxID=2593676 RepID=UPI0033F326C4
MELLDVLTELARSGRLGPVSNGAAWGAVTEALGAPFEMADSVELPVGLVEKRAFIGHPRQLYTPLTFDSQCAIQATPSGVVFVFEIPEGEDPILSVAGPRPHHHECPAATRSSVMPS